MDKVPDIVDLVLYFLGVLSVLVWSVIFWKGWAWLKIAKQEQRFMHVWRQLGQLKDVTALMSRDDSSFARLCTAGMRAREEVLTNVALNKSERQELLLVGLRQQAHLERKRLESGVALLASVGSTAPFIGLFGTVWGIMNALKDITATGSAGLDVVAGPIGEALIATAVGIATAIPAVLAYNYFMRRQRVHQAELEQVASRFQALSTHAGLGI